MKKLLLFFLFFAFSGAFAQDNPFNEDCTALTVGNLGTSTLGTIPGQHNWYTSVSTAAVPAGANSDFQVVNFDSTHGNVIQINGSAAAATSTTSQSRTIFQNISTAWNNRTTGNDIAELEYEFYTGDSTPSLDTFRSYIIDSGGIAVAGLYYEASSNIISGWAYYDATSSGGQIGYYTFQLGGTSTAPEDVVLDSNTWYRVGIAYDYNTGDVTWKESTGLFYGGTTGAHAGYAISKIQYTVSSATDNTDAAQELIDNISVLFDASENLLGTKSNILVADKFTVYPNPVKNVVTVSNADASISGIEITDLNGRVVKTLNVTSLNDVQVTVSDLAQGVYMMKITSDKGTATKKIIKE